jgi:hypothetical protein
MDARALLLVIIVVIKIVYLDFISYIIQTINLDLLLIKQRITIQIHMRKIEKPELISTIRDKKKVWLNIRESRLMYMFHRKLISMEEYEAGSRYRLMCELMGGSTGDYLKDRVDGTSTDFITSSLGAAMAVKDCDEQIGPSMAECMKLFCWFNYGIIEIAHILGLTERKASNRTHEGLSRLAIYYGYKKVHNTIKGQGTQNKKQKIPKMGSI